MRPTALLSWVPRGPNQRRPFPSLCPLKGFQLHEGGRCPLLWTKGPQGTLTRPETLGCGTAGGAAGGPHTAEETAWPCWGRCAPGWSTASLEPPFPAVTTAWPPPRTVPTKGRSMGPGALCSEALCPRKAIPPAPLALRAQRLLLQGAAPLGICAAGLPRPTCAASNHAGARQPTGSSTSLGEGRSRQMARGQAGGPTRVGRQRGRL